MSDPINRVNVAQNLALNLPTTPDSHQKLLESLAPAGQPHRAPPAEELRQLDSLVATDPDAAGAVIANALYRLDAVQSEALIRHLASTVNGDWSKLAVPAQLSVQGELSGNLLGHMFGMIPGIGPIVGDAVAMGTLAGALQKQAALTGSPEAKSMAERITQKADKALKLPETAEFQDAMLAMAKARADGAVMVDVGKEILANKVRTHLAGVGTSERPDPTEILATIDEINGFYEWASQEMGANMEELARRHQRVMDQVGTMTKNLSAAMDMPNPSVGGIPGVKK